MEFPFQLRGGFCAKCAHMVFIWSSATFKTAESGRAQLAKLVRVGQELVKSWQELVKSWLRAGESWLELVEVEKKPFKVGKSWLELAEVGRSWKKANWCCRESIRCGIR